jgi:hypothetical protein
LLSRDGQCHAKYNGICKLKFQCKCGSLRASTDGTERMVQVRILLHLNQIPGKKKELKAMQWFFKMWLNFSVQTKTKMPNLNVLFAIKY